MFKKFLRNKGYVVLDGAMATELEKRGADLNHGLWSAKILAEQPALIKQVHLDYLKAGADIITTASYQASFEGFAKYGYDENKAALFMQLSVELAKEARNEALGNNIIRQPLPLIAASIGPYGAFLADGSEYTGNYGINIDGLKNFHRKRMNLFAKSGADLMACETIPCADEATALVELLKELPDISAWISFSCRDGKHVCSGESFAKCINIVNQSTQVLAVGVNCTSPVYIESLIQEGAGITDKLFLVYPNKGELWDAQNKCWYSNSGELDFTQEVVKWRKAGATIFGGCCRTSPEDIRLLKERLEKT